MNSVQSLIFLFGAKECSIIILQMGCCAKAQTGRKKEYCYIAFKEIITLYSTVASLSFKQTGQVVI